MVEDDYFIASELEEWLNAAGSEVVGPVPGVDQALDLIEDDGLDAAVLDINLGDGITSYPIADRLGALGVPYLFASGSMKPPDASAYSRRPWLEKPYSETELLRTLGDLIGSA